MDPGTIYDRVRMRTLVALGKPVNLHLFRDGAATLLAETDAAGINNARSLLGHARLSTTERHYIHADRRKAIRAYQSVMRHRRDQPGRAGPSITRGKVLPS